MLGPALGPDYSHSIRLIKNLMDGTPGCPKIHSGFVYVRDVADLHLRAMLNPAANGQRFLAISGESMWMSDVAKVLQQRRGDAASKVRSRVLPNWLVRLASRKNHSMRAVVPLLGIMMNASGEKAVTMLGWQPRSREDAIVATADSLIELGLLSYFSK